MEDRERDLMPVWCFGCGRQAGPPPYQPEPGKVAGTSINLQIQVADRYQEHLNAANAQWCFTKWGTVSGPMEDPQDEVFVSHPDGVGYRPPAFSREKPSENRPCNFKLPGSPPSERLFLIPLLICCFVSVYICLYLVRSGPWSLNLLSFLTDWL